MLPSFMSSLVLKNFILASMNAISLSDDFSISYRNYGGTPNTPTHEGTVCYQEELITFRPNLVERSTYCSLDSSDSPGKVFHTVSLKPSLANLRDIVNATNSFLVSAESLSEEQQSLVGDDWNVDIIIKTVEREIVLRSLRHNKNITPHFLALIESFEGMTKSFLLYPAQQGV